MKTGMRIEYRIAALAWYRLHGPPSVYLRLLCRPSLSARGLASLRSSEQDLLAILFTRTYTRQSHAFSEIAPWISNAPGAKLTS